MEITFSGGTDISRACAALVGAANAAGCRVRGKFNGIEIVAQPNTSTADGLVAWYQGESRRRAEEYRKTPEYAAQLAAREKRARDDRNAFAAAMDGAPPMEFRNEADWNEAKANNQDGYGAAVYRYAENWARIMQKRIAAGETVAEAAGASQYIADPEGITGFMYGCAVQALAHCWIHGEELRRWHNLGTQIGTEGEKANESGGVLNPAVLGIG
jgi:hypothetical protein